VTRLGVSGTDGPIDGGPGPRRTSPMFETDWDLVSLAGQPGEPGARARERVTRRYWPAIYAYVRASVNDPEEAADLTQGFICDVVLGRRLLERAESGQGRFRSLLLTSVRNYLVERHRARTAAKRHPAGGSVTSMVGSEFPDVDGRAPELAYQREWAATIVRRVLRELEERCRRDGLDAHWAVFERRVARPILHGDGPAPYELLLDRLGLADRAQAANMMITVKRRFATMLRDEVAATMDDPERVDEELEDMLALLG